MSLRILFSPAESKFSGGNEKKRELFGSDKARYDILNNYDNIMKNRDENEIKQLFGLKKFSDCQEYIDNIFNTRLMYAIQRYNGVAYDYLKYSEQDKDTQRYLEENTIIFSNLYGPILANDTIANYKVKQGNNIGDIQPDLFYKKRFSYQLDLYLANSDILDLRAGYYNKFYVPNKKFTTLKFLKDGKVISHWAKAYRGIVLREIAKHQIKSIEEFKKLEIENLQIKEIKIIKNKTEIIYEILF